MVVAQARAVNHRRTGWHRARRVDRVWSRVAHDCAARRVIHGDARCCRVGERRVGHGVGPRSSARARAQRPAALIRQQGTHRWHRRPHVVVGDSRAVVGLAAIVVPVAAGAVGRLAGANGLAGYTDAALGGDLAGEPVGGGRGGAHLVEARLAAVDRLARVGTAGSGDLRVKCHAVAVAAVDSPRPGWSRRRSGRRAPSPAHRRVAFPLHTSHLTSKSHSLGWLAQ